jgi:hypothetical protein
LRLHVVPETLALAPNGKRIAGPEYKTGDINAITVPQEAMEHIANAL